MKLTYPGGKRCAFSIFDDTDVATLESIRPLYDYLHELGIHTTKTVWGIEYDGKSPHAGSETLQNADYAAYMQELERRGFEIGFHGATMESATRQEIERSLAVFNDVIGKPPRINAAHGRNRDNLYWGSERFTFALTKRLYALLSGDDTGYFQGHISESPYFWGDLAKQHFAYVRSFTFSGIDILKHNAPLVYRSAKTPWVNAWFMSCDAENVEEFNALIASQHQNALEQNGGLCIISTHLGKGFVENGEVHKTTRKLLAELSTRDCWFAPVSEILDFYVAQRGCVDITQRQLLALELRWFVDSVKRRLLRKSYRPTELAYLKRS